MIHVKFLKIEDIKPILPPTSITRVVARQSDDAIVRLGAIVTEIAQTIRNASDRLARESDAYLARSYRLQHADTLGLSDAERVQTLREAGYDETLARHVVNQRRLTAPVQDYLSQHYRHAPAIARPLAAHPMTTPLTLSELTRSKDSEARLIAAKSISSYIRKIGIGQTQTQVFWLSSVIHATDDRAVATQLISVCVDETTIDATFYKHSGIMGMPAKYLGVYLKNPYTPETVLTTIQNASLLELTQEGRDAKREAGQRLAKKQEALPEGYHPMA